MPMKVRYTVVNGEVIAEERGGVRRQLVPDPLGSTRALLDNTQTQTDTFTYWPFGEEQNRTGTTATPFRFVGTAGYYRDSANLTYVRARYLRTDICRWQTPDPIGLYGDDYNLYRYVWNMPVTMNDISGLGPPRKRPPHPGGAGSGGSSGTVTCPPPKPNCAAQRAFDLGVCQAILTEELNPIGWFLAATMAICLADPDPISKILCITAALSAAQADRLRADQHFNNSKNKAEKRYRDCVAQGGTP